MGIDNREMAEFANNLWENFIKFRHKEANLDTVSFYKAEITAKPGNGKFSIKRPFDTNSFDVMYAAYMADAPVGTQVLVLRFGEGINLANHFVIDNAARTTLAEYVAKMTVIGTTSNEYNSSAVSVPNGSTTTACSLTLSAGTWIVIGGCIFPSNANGSRFISISSSSAGSATTGTSAEGHSSNGTPIQCVFNVNIGQATTYYLRVYQNSGSALTVPAQGAYIRATRIA